MKDEADYKELKKWLQRGDIKKLREAHGLTADAASRILRGERMNVSFLEAVTAKAIENKQRITGGIARLKQIGA